MEHFGPLAERLLPADSLVLFDDDLDLADVVDALGDVFGLHITRDDYADVDGTLDNLIRLVASRVGCRPVRPARQSPL